MWDLATGQPIRRLPCRMAFVTAVTISPDGRFVAMGSLNGGVAVWHTPDASRVLVGGDRSLAVYSVTSASKPVLTAQLLTSARITAVAVNTVMPQYALFGTASGQVAYVRLAPDGNVEPWTSAVRAHSRTPWSRASR